MAKTEREGGFYQFHLCLMAAPWSFPVILDTAFQFGVGNYLASAIGPEWKTMTTAAEFDRAREVVGFTGGAFREFVAGYERASAFVARWKEKSGRSPCYARVRTDLHFAARTREELSEREWRILIGIFSAIGDKPMVKLGWRQIQWRAAGWASEPMRSGGLIGPLYSRGQIERTLLGVIARGFVFAATYRKGERYWSHRLNQGEIWQQIETLKLASRSSSDRRRLDDNRSALLRARLDGKTSAGIALRAG